MNFHTIIQSQYLGSLEMFRRAISGCPDTLWVDPSYTNRFWHIAYHTLYYTHLYLQDSEAAFIPWRKHRWEYQYLGPLPAPPHKMPEIGEPYTKEDVLAYEDVCRSEVAARVPAIDPDAASGFSWLPFTRLELQFYNIRHLQHHTGQLIDRLRTRDGIGIGWVGWKTV